MARVARILVLALVAGIVSVPVAIGLTIALLPFWSWIEATYGIESIGHSGPSDWCFYVIYGVLNAFAFAFIRVYLRLGSAKVR